MKSKQLLLLIVSLFLVVSLVSAEDEAADMMAQYGPMGQPEEMKSMDWFIGDWDVTQQWKMDPASEEWEKSTATATYSFILDGCVLMMDYKSEMMGMPFNGVNMITYDRVLKEFQSVWVDNLSGRVSLYKGNKSGDSTIYTGVDFAPDGNKYLAKIIISNKTENSFDWVFDMSMDEGKTYFTSGKAKYTKKK